MIMKQATMLNFVSIRYVAHTFQSYNSSDKTADGIVSLRAKQSLQDLTVLVVLFMTRYDFSVVIQLK